MEQPHGSFGGSGVSVQWEGEGDPLAHEVRTGDARPAGTGVAHAFRGGDEGMTLLIYGTREPNDMCSYPRSGRVFFGGLGLATRVGERLDYWEGED